MVWEDLTTVVGRHAGMKQSTDWARSTKQVVSETEVTERGSSTRVVSVTTTDLEWPCELLKCARREVQSG